ncbi:MAG: acyl-CoA/acyl-ACP dehydrogenase [Gammaproteobacteria bacterium]|nr:acyl-CoA/acyl-ACP dehydrogenase [Gammaproteobacteria bacterium]
MSMSFSQDEQRLLEANDCVVAALAGVAAECDRDRCPPREAWTAYVAAGLKGLLTPKDKGGHAARAAVMTRMSEALGAVDPIGAITFLPQEYCIAAIAQFGQHAWHDEIRATLLAGAKTTGFVLTEPGAGSDAARITTLASRTSEGWRIDGVKAWVTNAPYIDEYFVFVQTEAGSGAAGIAGFLVPRDAPGLTVSAPYELLGGHIGNICDLHLDDVRIAPERLVVPPGMGLRAALSAIDLARINVAAMCCGALATGLAVALDYTTQRHAFGRPIAQFQGLQWQLAEVATDLHASRLMTYDAADALDQSGRASVEAAHAKKFATRAALRGLDVCMSQMGANGLKRDCGLPRLFEHVKIAHSLDGTTDIQNVVISRALLAPYRERLGA